MIAAAGARFPGQSAPAAAPSADRAERAKHWSRSVYYVRKPDLCDEVQRQVGKAETTFNAVFRALRQQERKGRTPELKQAAAALVLSEVGASGVAKVAGVSRGTARRHLQRLVELGLVAVDPSTHRLRLGSDGKIVSKTGGREYASTIRVTIRPEHLRPVGAGYGSKRTGGTPAPMVQNGALPRSRPLQGRESKPEPPPREPALSAGSVPADGGKAAASPPPPPSPVPVAGIVSETEGTNLIVRCPICETSIRLQRGVAREWHSSGRTTGRCPRCESTIVTPSVEVVVELTAIPRSRQLTAEERRLAADDIAARLAGLTAGGGRGSMEGGQPVGIAGGAVSVRPSSRGPEPEPEPEPSSPGRARSVASDARCPSTVPDAGGAADRAAAGTPEGDDEADALERIVEERRRQDAALGYDVSPAFNRQLVRQITGPLTTRS